MAQLSWQKANSRWALGSLQTCAGAASTKLEIIDTEYRSQIVDAGGFGHHRERLDQSMLAHYHLRWGSRA
ncbi:hypothetical protein CFAM422_007987 [Trichoderma lentiforme]|uniref:Uncharacterized protein n=1 Tax=Trichoderma lentiforme TaxID=1567552 RepID=A0A9P5CCV0_9HYPO|nr:hypothetical protein CFAM422_007987 [Trichoderma lentiforme]